MLKGGKYDAECIMDTRGFGQVYVGAGYNFKCYGRKKPH